MLSIIELHGYFTERYTKGETENLRQQLQRKWPEYENGLVVFTGL